MTEPSRSPGLKGLAKNKIVWIGGGIAAVFILYEYRKQKQAAAVNAASAAAPTSTDTSGDTSSYDSGYSAASDAYAGGIGSPYGSINTENISSTGYSSNSQWSAGAETALIGAGYSGTTAAAALGHYLIGGTALTSDEESIIQSAIALVGPPPVPVATSLTPPAGQVSAVAVTGQFTPGNQNTIRNDLTGEIDQVESDGSLYHLSPAQFAELKNPVSSEQHYSG